jgi:hypothetical protein
MSTCHEFAPKPTPLLALLALGLVHRYQPAWLAVELQQAAHSQGVSAVRVSRLVTRALERMEVVLVELTRRGRPPHDPRPSQCEAELARTRALLEVATAILSRVSLRRRGVQSLIVGAWQRLHSIHSLSQQQFCRALALSPRTLRAWIARDRCDSQPFAASLEHPAAPAGPRRRPPRRPRFGFDVLLPKTQFAGDTTDLRAFGIPLKLVAAQDLGGRDQALFDAVLVDDHESADHVVRVLTEAVASYPGAQVLTDQGTPYMAGAVCKALQELETEHAPQKEGDPTGKATLERAFRSAKTFAVPLLRLTDRLAAQIPALRDPDLAKSATRVLLTALLRAYQAGARATRRALEARDGLDLETLSQATETSREQARATDRSRRLLLARIHSLYQLPGASQRFVNALYRYPLEVLQQAEQTFQGQVHRDDIRDRASYFAAIVRRLDQGWRKRRAGEQRQRAEDQRRERERAAWEAERKALRADPIGWLRKGVALLELAWQPDVGRLLFAGKGAGRGTVRLAIQRLVELFGPTAARDAARGVFHGFYQEREKELGVDALDAIKAVFENVLDEVTSLDAKLQIAPDFPAVILPPTGGKRRPPPSPRLRN